ncbi:putative bifunctional diguanylate cyclase/phosphodiesterase [Actinospica robiniae]|uniref:putative bifunctional diguanylate cyclase/phosphodiesterase n=1 Tax=Actinospica robiniae TaxID=304901 RepID=UPI00040C68D4|nr:EAL domain-containing protein [Actinospica robiniae]
MLPSAGPERGLGPPAVSARAPAWAMRVYLAAFAVLTALYFTLPSWRGGDWAAMGLFATLAMLWSLARYRPLHRAPWLLLAGALVTLVSTDAVDLARNARSGSQIDFFPNTDWFPTTPEEVALLAYPLAAVGLWLFIRHQRNGRDAAAVIDALIVITAVALLAWTFIVWPTVDDPNRTALAREVAFGYPLGDVLLLALLARLMTGSDDRPESAWLLCFGALGLLLSDLFFELRITYSSWHSGSAMDLGWIVFFCTWGLAALTPSMTRIGRPVNTYRAAQISRLGFALLAVATLTAPAVLLGAALRGSVDQGWVLAGFAALSSALVLARLGLVLRSYRRAINRSRVLRAAGTDLVAALSVDQIGLALDRAGSGLLGPAEGRIRLLADLRDPLAAARYRPVPVGQLPAVVAAGCATGLPGAAHALVYPLRAKRSDLRAGLVALGPRDDLAALRETVEILAGQAALALDRVELADEIRGRDNEAYFRTLIHNAADVFMIVDEGQAVRYASPSARKLFDGRELTGAKIAELVGARNASSARAVLSGMESGPVEWVIEPGRRDKLWVQARSDDLRTDPTVGGVVLTLRDVTEQRRLEGELRHHAYHDPLTGLANRRSLQDRLGHAVEHARRTGRAACLLMIDLDDFKDVNDTKGHGVGDELLAAVAERLLANIRPVDLAARLGGDEFAVLVPDVRRPHDADGLARRLTEAFEVPFALPDGAVTSGASIGVASTLGCESADDLLRNADLALYAAKDDGKRRWRLYDPGLHDQAIERTLLRDQLARAIDEETVLVHYQPVVEIGDGRVASFEALARWPHPARGLIGPDAFIPLAEETGLILPLGRLLLRQAVQRVAGWNAERSAAEAQAPAGSLKVPPLSVAVNVSLQQLRDPRFPAETIELLRETGLSSDLLVLELTESDLMRHHDEQAKHAMNELKASGVRIAIDDFGTGYSSLSYLRELPIDVLKIDKSFIADIATSPEQAALVEGIIRIADGLGLSVVAEGVETGAQWDRLGGCDCDYGQGYLFAAPLPADQVTALLETHRDPRLPESLSGHDALRGAKGADR